jgi:tryptophan synthase alpha chain
MPSETEKAFIAFVTAGDPDLETTETLSSDGAGGSGLIEVGIPFSDPSRREVTIQRASERALAAGVTTDKIFEMVSR